MSRASPLPVRAVDSPYQQFLATVGRQPTAAQCEQWADEHPGDPDQGRALVHAGWLTARGKQHQGDDAKALELFTRATKLSGAAGRQAQVGVVQTLYAQDRERDAEQAEQALREELTEQPDEAVADLQVFDDMVDMLGEIGRSERALDWCLAVLGHPAARENEGTVGGEAARLRRGLRISRALLRRDLSLEPTDDDLAAEAETDSELREFGEELDRGAEWAAVGEAGGGARGHGGLRREIDLRPGSGVVAICRRGRILQPIGLRDLPLPDPPPRGRRMDRSFPPLGPVKPFGEKRPEEGGIRALESTGPLPLPLDKAGTRERHPCEGCRPRGRVLDGRAGDAPGRPRASPAAPVSCDGAPTPRAARPVRQPWP
ncbi:hypothetical protein ACFRIB_00230 [Streptomyces mirabilis]|uniref:hypothetical protein n=1 Tax=Streptomyces mirabilis TaxID=68239 RepID=UPI0036B4512E